MNIQDDNYVVGIVERQIRCWNPVTEVSVLIVKGTLKIGSEMLLNTCNGCYRVRVLNIRDSSGYVLEANHGTHTIISLSGVPLETEIMYHSLLSSDGVSPEQYSERPFIMEVGASFVFERHIVLVGYIEQGTIQVGDNINISNEYGNKSSKVLAIEQFKKYKESMSYGELCGLILVDLCTNSDEEPIAKGSIVTVID